MTDDPGATVQIGHRILLLGATAVLLVGGLGFAGILAAARGEEVRLATANDRMQLQAAYEMSLAAREMRRYARVGLQTGADAAALEVERQLALYRELAASERPAEQQEELRLSTEIEASLAETRAAPLRSEQRFAANDALIARINHTVKQEQAELAAATKAAIDVIQGVKHLAFVFPLLAFGLIAALSLGLLLPLRRKLQGLQEAARRVAGGDTGTEVPVEGNDELDQVAAAFNEMQRELRRTTVSRTELESHLVALREARAQLVLADRMALVGTLASGVAHEINNPLAYLSSNLEWLRAELAQGGPPSPELLKAVDEAVEGASRIGTIVGDLQAFSREDETRTHVDVRQVVEDAVRLAGHEIRHVAEVERELQAVPPVLGNRMRLGQVVLHLLVNAAQSYPQERVGSGRIRVRTRAEEGRAILEVEDDGAGVPEEIRHRIFDPFFTTKPLGVGTGLGLSVCIGIVAAHGGELELVPGESGGSLFRVVLPAAVAKAA